MNAKLASLAAVCATVLAHPSPAQNGFVNWEISSFLDVNNLLDEEYNNIRINAFGERFFEPAPKRNAFIGITIRKRFRG